MINNLKPVPNTKDLESTTTPLTLGGTCATLRLPGEWKKSLKDCQSISATLHWLNLRAED